MPAFPSMDPIYVADRFRRAVQPFGTRTILTTMPKAASEWVFPAEDGKPHRPQFCKNGAAAAEEGQIRRNREVFAIKPSKRPRKGNSQSSLAAETPLPYLIGPEEMG